MHAILRTTFFACLCAAFLGFTTGCNKLAEPEKEKPATRSTPSEPPASNGPGQPSNSAATSPPASTAPMPPVPRTPAQIVDEFLAMEPRLKTDEVLKELAAIPEAVDRITGLDLAATPVTDDGLKTIATLKKIETLKVAGRISSEGLKVLPELPQLAKLDIASSSLIEERGFAQIDKCPALVELNMQGITAGDEIFAELKTIRTLQVLRVANCLNVTGRYFSDTVSKGGLPELREIYAGGSPFIHYGLLQLNRLKHLEVLEASHAEMNDGVIPGFENCRTLKRLNISGGKVSNAGLKMLSKLKQLDELNVGDSKGINDAGLAFLKQHRQLKRLNLDGTSCTPAGVEALKKVLKETTIRYAGAEL